MDVNVIGLSPQKYRHMCWTSHIAVLICLLDIQGIAANVQYIVYLFDLFSVCENNPLQLKQLYFRHVAKATWPVMNAKTK